MTPAAAAPHEFQFVTERTGCVLTASARGVKVSDPVGVTKGMVVFDGWTKNAVMAHIAADSPMAWRKLLPAACSYIFEEAGLGVIVGSIASSNRKSLSFVKRAGFRPVGSVRDGIALGVDLMLFELRRENCRFISQHRSANG
jgi:L-amino acid N-acyltransferase YncA